MELVIVSFIAGVLTVAAPCILPLLPIIIGSSVLHPEDKDTKDSIKHPLIIITSLAISIILFTLLLKATTILLGIPSSVWNIIAGGIVILFGINLLAPAIWEKIMIATRLQARANQMMGKSQQGRSGIKKDILLGASLGPVFNSCSPTYALIVAAILPASFALGLAYLISYVLGLASILLLISLFGRTIVQKMRWLANPNNLFKKIIGVLLIVVGLLIVTGMDKHIQTYVLENGWYDPIMQVEETLRK